MSVGSDFNFLLVFWHGMTLTYCLPKEIVTIMMLYKDTKAIFHSLHTHFLDIVAGVLQGNTLAPLLFIICLDYVLRISIVLMKENDFILKKARSRQYPAETIMDANYADDLALLTNTSAQAKTLLYSLKQDARGISLYKNTDKTRHVI